MGIGTIAAVGALAVAYNLFKPGGKYGSQDNRLGNIFNTSSGSSKKSEAAGVSNSGSTALSLQSSTETKVKDSEAKDPETVEKVTPPAKTSSEIDVIASPQKSEVGADKNEKKTTNEPTKSTALKLEKPEDCVTDKKKTSGFDDKQVQKVIEQASQQLLRKGSPTLAKKGGL